jgi:WD40 repeat protein
MKRRAQKIQEEFFKISKSAEIIKNACRIFLPFCRAAHKIKALSRGYLDRKRYKEFKLRTQAAREIVLTEETFVNNMTFLVTNLYDPLVNPSEKKIISLEDIKNIFSQIKVITAYNTAFLNELKHLLSKWNYFQCLGPTILTMTEFLKVYIQYVNNFDNALKTIHRCMKKESFVRFLQSRNVSESQLQSLLIQPIQRIPRYVLLLETLLKYTRRSHEDYEPTMAALCRIKEIADLINQKKREVDNFQELLVLSRKIDPPIPGLVDSKRVVLAKGDIFLMNPEKNKAKEYYYIMFNDFFLLTIKKDDIYLIRYSVSVAGSSFTRGVDDLSIIFTGASKKQLILKFKSIPERLLFSSQLEEAIKNANNSLPSFFKDSGAIKKVVALVGQLKAETSDSVQNLCAMSNGNLWAAHGDGVISVWNIQNYTKLKEFKTPATRVYTILEVGETVWCSSEAKSLFVFHRETFELLKVLNTSGGVIKSMILVNNNTNQKSHDASDFDVALMTKLKFTKSRSKNNKLAVVKMKKKDRPILFAEKNLSLFEDDSASNNVLAGYDVWTASCLEDSIVIWDIQKLALKARITVSQAITAMAQYQNTVWLGSVSGNLYLLNIETHEISPPLKAHKEIINSIVISDQNQVWTCSNDNTIAVWDIQTQGLVKKLECPAKVLCMAKMKGKGHIWAGLWSSEIVIFDTKKLEFVQELKDFHKDAVRSLAQVSESEMWSGGRELDGTIGVWSYDFLKRTSAVSILQYFNTNLHTTPRNSKNDNVGLSVENRMTTPLPTLSASSIFVTQTSPRSNMGSRLNSPQRLTPRQDVNLESVSPFSHPPLSPRRSAESETPKTTGHVIAVSNNQTDTSKETANRNDNFL